MTNKKNNEKDIINYIDNIVFFPIVDTDHYTKRVESLNVRVLYDAIRGFGLLFFNDALELAIFDSNDPPQDDHMLMALGCSIFHKILEFDAYKGQYELTYETIDFMAEEYTNKALNDLLADLNTNWDSNKCTLDDYIVSNWAMVVYDSEDFGSFGIPVKINDQDIND